MNILIVRLGALGDIVHAIPVAAAVRAAHPSARIDWLVEARHKDLLDLVTVLDRVIAVDAPTGMGWLRAIRQLRASRYDVALDLQGLMKSAVLARASGADRVIGFSIWHLREKTARPFYTEVGELPHGTSELPPATSKLPPEGGSYEVATSDSRGFRLQAEAPTSRAEDPPALQADEPHVIGKNLRMLRAIGIESAAIDFPLRDVASAALDDVRRELGDAPFAVINPGAAWPNKRWPADRFGAVAAFLRDVRRLRSIVLWGPGEAPLAHAVTEASDGAAILAPPTQIGDLVALSRAAALMISGDTGPLHIAAAVGTPTIALFGPTDPLRNGPFDPSDAVVSRYESCACHYERRCHQAPAWCLGELSVTEVTAAIQHRLARSSTHG